MGEHKTDSELDPERLRISTQRLLEDLRVLDRLVEDGRIETGVTRIGAEQELVLVGPDRRPAPKGPEVLAEIEVPNVTTELARFDLEINLSPVEVGPGALDRLRDELESRLVHVRAKAAQHDAEVLLTGILPTLEKSDLSLENMTPIPRYFALAQAVRELRGGDFELHLKGRDELTVRHESVMLEACNTSWQVHLQVAPERFIEVYNLAQAVAAPVLAASTFSPLLFGRRLWKETRIAVFQHAVDTRSPSAHRRTMQGRVRFGEDWARGSVTDLFQEDIARFRLILSARLDEDPLEMFERGEVPALQALCLHNGTVYRWNRPCYGRHAGVAHLRIEARYLPSGPSVADQIANTALWVGLLASLRDDVGDVTRHLSFAEARESFVAAARHGLDAQLAWVDSSRRVPADELLRRELIPRAREGVRSLGLEADSWIDLVEERVDSRRTGSSWILASLDAMSDGSPAERHAALVDAMLRHQRDGDPVHLWRPAGLRDGAPRQSCYDTVGGLMTTDLFTVGEDEVIDLVASIMDWKHVRHVPVEDRDHRLVGLVTHRALLRALAEEAGKPRRALAVRSIMVPDPVVATPDMPTLEAIGIMKQARVSVLPVVEDGVLVGIFSERDLMPIATHLLERFLAGEG